MNTYIDEGLESEGAISSTPRMHRIIYANYKKDDMKKVMTEQCQHLSTKELERLLKLLRKFEYFLTVR